MRSVRNAIVALMLSLASLAPSTAHASTGAVCVLTQTFRWTKVGALYNVVYTGELQCPTQMASAEIRESIWTSSYTHLTSGTLGTCPPSKACLIVISSGRYRSGIKNAYYRGMASFDAFQTPGFIWTGVVGSEDPHNTCEGFGTNYVACDIYFLFKLEDSGTPQNNTAKDVTYLTFTSSS